MTTALSRRPAGWARLLAEAAAAQAVLAALVLAASWWLPVRLDWSYAADRTLFVELRLPTYALAGLVGGALAVAGLILQTVVLNPLASPYVMGVSAGGSLATVLVLAWVPPGLAVWMLRPAAALLGGVLALAWVLFLAGRVRGGGPWVLLLAGVVVNVVCSSALLLVTYWAPELRTVRIVHWLMGGLPDPAADWEVGLTLVLALVGTALATLSGGQLNLLLLPAEEAATLGLDVERARRWGFVLAALLTAAAVSAAGPVGFVGLLVPHAVRRLWGLDHRRLVPLAFAGGGGLLVLAEGLARTVVYPEQLPVGVVTALVGGIAFLGLVVRMGPEGGGR